MSDDHDLISWRCVATVDKFRAGETTPYETIVAPGNLLMNGGISNIWQYLIGNGVTTPGATLAYIDATNGFLGVGDSTTAVNAEQTDLQAATNKVREILDAAPTHTPGTTSAAATITFIATFETGDANFAWNEWGIFNAITDSRMFNRKVQSFGTKTSADSWILTVTVTLA